MESSSEFNFMSLDGLPIEDQAKLHSILYGEDNENAEDKQEDMSDESADHTRSLNVHAQVFVPKVGPVRNNEIVPYVPVTMHGPHGVPHGLTHVVRPLPDALTLSGHNIHYGHNLHMLNGPPPPLNPQFAAAFLQHHLVPPPHLPPQQQHQQQHQVHIPNHLTHVPPPHVDHHSIHQQQQQHQQQQAQLQINHYHQQAQQHFQQQQQQFQQQQHQQQHPPQQQQHPQPQQHQQQQHHNNAHQFNEHNGGYKQNYKQDMPPRYQRNNHYDKQMRNEWNNGRGWRSPRDKRVTVLQNPKRHMQGVMGPRFYRHQNREYRDHDDRYRRPEREYTRKFDQDINSNMLKLQNGLEPKFDRSSPNSDDDEHVFVRLSSGAPSPSSVKWPSDASNTGSPQSRSLSPASSHVPHAQEPSTMADYLDHSANSIGNDSGIVKTESSSSLVSLEGVEIARKDYNIVEDEWNQDGVDPDDEWSTIAPETPWSAGYVADNDSTIVNEESTAECNEESAVSKSDNAEEVAAQLTNLTVTEDETQSNTDDQEKQTTSPVFNGTKMANDVKQVNSTAKVTSTQVSAPIKSGDVKSTDRNTTRSSVPRAAVSSEAGVNQSPKMAECQPLPQRQRPSHLKNQANGSMQKEVTKVRNAPARPTSGDNAKVSRRSGPVEQQKPTAEPGKKEPRQRSRPNTPTEQKPQPPQGPPSDTAKPQPPPGPPISEPPKPQKRQKSWAAMVSHNLRDTSQPPLVIRDEPLSLIKHVETEKDLYSEEDEITNPSSDKLMRKLKEFVSKTSLHHRPPSVFPRGLINRANWCYVNATLQALLACPPLYNLFRNLPRMNPKDRGQSCTPVIDSIVEFVQQFNFMKPQPSRSKKHELPSIPTEEPFEPDYVYSMLMKLKSTDAFKQGRQEDAEEFLTCVLNHMHEELLAVAGNGINPHAKAVNNNNNVAGVEEGADDVADDWEQVGRKKKAVITRSNDMHRSLVSDIFCGQIRSVLRSNGARESATLEPFFTLPLDIQHEKIRSVKDALTGLVSRESIQGFTCSKTKEEVEATRCTMLELLPPVLVLHLKCFIYDTNGGCQKLSKDIDYTVDLEINKDIISPNARAKIRDHQRSYKLFAVVYHRGKTLQGGHYTTDVYHSGINGWIRIDDHNVSVVPVSQVLQYEAPYMPYLLYYRRHDSLVHDRGLNNKS